MSRRRGALLVATLTVWGAISIALGRSAGDEAAPAVAPPLPDTAASEGSPSREVTATSAPSAGASTPAARSALVHYYGENRPFPADAAARGVVVANPWYRDQARSIDRAHPEALVLAYKNVWAVTTAGERDGSLPAGLAYEAVAARTSWQLRDGAGRWLRFEDYPNLWQVDAGDPAYQAAWVASVLADLAGGPFDGVFLDDLLTRAEAHHPGVTSPRYPDDAALQAATTSFLDAVVPQLRAAGLVVVGNIPAAYRHRGLWTDWLGRLDGAMEENFVHYSNGQFVDDGAGEWSAHVEQLEQAHQLGKTLIVHTERGGGDDAAARTYGYASFLLAAGQRAFFSYGDTFTLVAEMHLDLGAALEARRELAPGVWGRRFANGMAIVNPTRRTVTVDLPEPLRVSGTGTPVTSMTIEATRAALLVR